MEINKRNSANQLHGYLDSSGLISHYYNDIRVGCYLGSHYKCHFLNGKEIGCEMWGGTRTQHFYNKQSKLFGEAIEWLQK